MVKCIYNTVVIIIKREKDNNSNNNNNELSRDGCNKIIIIKLIRTYYAKH